MNSKIDKDRRFKAAYPISHHGLQSVFQLLSKPVALQYIDDSNVKQETVAAHITSRNAPSPVKNNSTSNLGKQNSKFIIY